MHPRLPNWMHGVHLFLKCDEASLDPQPLPEPNQDEGQPGVEHPGAEDEAAAQPETVQEEDLKAELWECLAEALKNEYLLVWSTAEDEPEYVLCPDLRGLEHLLNMKYGLRLGRLMLQTEHVSDCQIMSA